MKKCLYLWFVLLSGLCGAREVCTVRPLVITVIDTGFGYHGFGKGTRLCKYGHRDFTSDQLFSKSYDTIDPVPVDRNGHGTNVAGLIDRYAQQKGTNYCMVILKYYSPDNPRENVENTIKAIRYATNIHADYINYSAGGNAKIQKEFEAVERFLNGGGIFVAAAGNDSSNLDLGILSYYPAMYDDRIISVGNLDINGKIAKSSNYGKKVKRWEIGTHAFANGIALTGSSQAAAIASGKIVGQRKRSCN